MPLINELTVAKLYMMMPIWPLRLRCIVHIVRDTSNQTSKIIQTFRQATEIIESHQYSTICDVWFRWGYNGIKCKQVLINKLICGYCEREKKNASQSKYVRTVDCMICLTLFYATSYYSLWTVSISSVGCDCAFAMDHAYSPHIFYLSFATISFPLHAIDFVC